ncbi:MAG: arginine--tRNA ligase [Planctomycetota bacterium]
MPVRQAISDVIRTALKEVPGVDPGELDELSSVDYGRGDRGDLVTPVAMRLAKGAGETPRELADRIAGALREEGGELGAAIDRVEVAGPGFVNIYLSRAFWLGLVRRIIAQGPRYGRSKVGRRRKVQLEFASANPTGPLSVAHGRQAALGDVLANILAHIGFDVSTEYWVNDWGNQIEKLGESVYVRYLHALGDRSAEFPEDGYKGAYIRELGSDIAATQGRRYAGMPRDGAVSELGRFAADHILGLILADFRRFGIEHHTVFSQREFESRGHVERLLDRVRRMGLTYEKDGAVWMRTSDYGDEKDRVLVKSDGTWAYRLSDIAYHEDKFQRGFERVIDMFGPDHHGHVVTMQAAMKALGHPVDTVRFLIVQHCSIIREGEKTNMSTRAGKVITLDEVIEEVGVDVARFLFLTQKTDSHLDFDLELAKQESLDNPVYYIQYAHARIASILRKAQQARRIDRTDVTRGVFTGGDKSELAALEDRDVALARKLARFPAVLERAGLELEPHRLTNYLNELAAEFHNYYTQCVVIGEDETLTRARLQLVSAVRVVLGNALHLLGVHIPETM